MNERAIAPKVIFGAGTAVSVLLYFLFYPPIYAFSDESVYMAMAGAFRHGHLFINTAVTPVASWLSMNGHQIPDYPPGMWLLLAPFASPSSLIFVPALGMYLLGAFYFNRYLKSCGIVNAPLTLLYLFHPIVVFYSRTIMSDLPAAVIFLAGVFYYFRDNGGWKAGFCFGLSLLFRFSHLVYILPFAAFLLWRRKSPAFFCVLALFAAAAAFHRVFLYGIPLTDAFTQKFVLIPFFSPAYFPRNFPHYVTSLFISWPLMLLAPFLAKRTRRPEILFSILAGVLFFSFFYHRDEFQTPLQSLVAGVRFLLPAALLILLMYADVLDALLAKARGTFKTLLMLPVCAGLAGVSIFIHVKHQEALKEQYAMKETIYRNTTEGSAVVYDNAASELMQEAWGKRDYIYWRDDEQGFRNWLNTADYGKGVYIVNRDDSPGELSLSWVDQLPALLESKQLETELAGKHGQVEIYRVHERTN